MLGEMSRAFFSDNPLVAGPLIAMVVFTTVFVVAAIWALRADRKHVERVAHLPLEGDGEKHV